MRYPTDAAGTAFQSVKQTFTAADSDKKVFTFEKEWLRILHPESKVSFKLTTNGQEYTFDTYLKIEKAVVDEPFFDHSALFSLHQRLGRFWLYHSGRCSLYQRKHAFPLHPRQLSHAYDSALRHGHVLLGLRLRPESTTWKTDDTQDQERAIKEFDKRSAADKLLAAAGVYRNVNTTTTPKLLGVTACISRPLRPCRGYRRSDQSSSCAETAARRLPLRRLHPNLHHRPRAPSLPGSISAWAPASASASA